LSALRVLVWLSPFAPLAAQALPMPPEPAPPLLSESEEIRISLEAAPAHLRDDAGVYVLESSGYRLARASRNGFHCIIERIIATAFEPRCFDAEGSETLLPVVLFRAELRARGAKRAAIEREVAARFQRGEFSAPRRVGICYMLSTHNVVVVDGESRRVQRVGPRLLFYAPNLGSADLGATPDLEARMLVIDENSATAMIAVPVVSAKRTRANYLSPEGASPLSRSVTTAAAEAAPQHGFADGISATTSRRSTDPGSDPP
jgi:hypothetical protein